MVRATATSYKPTPAGNYRGKLTKVEEKKNDTGLYWVWSFQLIEDMSGEAVDEEFETFTVASSAAFTPKAKARRWVQSMIGRILEDDEEVDFDEELIGKTYFLGVGINENSRNTLDSILPTKKSKGQDVDYEKLRANVERPENGEHEMASSQQVNAIYKLGHSQMGWSNEETESHVSKTFSALPADLTTKEAETIIARLQGN